MSNMNMIEKFRKKLVAARAAFARMLDDDPAVATCRAAYVSYIAAVALIEFKLKPDATRFEIIARHLHAAIVCLFAIAGAVVAELLVFFVSLFPALVIIATLISFALEFELL